MTATAFVLLSAGRHPVSGRPAPVPAEIAATALGGQVAEAVVGLHAGPDRDAVADHLGLGLARIVHLPLPAGGDPLPALAAWLAAQPPAPILAGHQGLGGEDSGMLPYRLAQRLGLPIVAGVAALRREADGIAIDQAQARGRRRRTRLAGGFVATVAARAPVRIYAPGAARRGRIDTVAAPAPAPPFAAVDERPLRPRPRLIAGGPAAAGDGRLLVDPTPAEAAAAIVAYLRALGLIAG